MSRSPSAQTPGWSRANWRPDPCLFLELQEVFYGRYVPVRWRQPPGHAHFGDEPLVQIGHGGKPLDPVFYEDAQEVIYHWISYWSCYRTDEVRRAFRVEVLSRTEGIEVRPVPGNLDVPFILTALRENHATLCPTLH